MKVYRVKILGCGGSSGVPSIEKGWGDCDYLEERNNRTRSSALVSISSNEGIDFNILFDVSPDFRHQALKNEVKHIDNIFFTHAHADHINGLDDIRGINRLMNRGIKGYGHSSSNKAIKDNFPYIFSGLPNGYRGDIFFRPVIELIDINYNESITLANNSVIRTSKQVHGKIETTGYVIDKKIGYATDFVSLSEDAIENYKNLDLIIISAFTIKKHVAHMNLEEVLELIDYINPGCAILTHMGETMDYESLRKLLPNKVIPGYDGLIIKV